MKVHIEKLDARHPTTEVTTIYERSTFGEITDEWAEEIADVIRLAVEGHDFPAFSTASEIVYLVVVCP
jgi:hypothetical protein